VLVDTDVNAEAVSEEEECVETREVLEPEAARADMNDVRGEESGV
jgi:hypothetical protein